MLLTCEDCGHQVSDAAVACPSCGRPTGGKPGGSCQRCGAGNLATGTGIHGVLEVVTVIIWTMAFIPVGLLLFYYLNRRPWCPACKRRPVGTVNPGSLVALALLGALAAWWTFALVTGTAQ